MPLLAFSTRCPTGENTNVVGVNDIQLVNCTGGFGVFKLSFRNATTKEMPYDITVEDLESNLEAMPW